MRRGKFIRAFVVASLCLPWACPPARASDNASYDASRHVYSTTSTGGTHYQFALHGGASGVTGLYQRDWAFGTVRGNFEQDGRTLVLNYRSENGKETGRFWLRLSVDGKLMLTPSADEALTPRGRESKWMRPAAGKKDQCGGAVSRVGHMMGSWIGDRGETATLRPGQMAKVTGEYVRPKRLESAGKRDLEGRVSLDGGYMHGRYTGTGKGKWHMMYDAVNKWVSLYHKSDTYNYGTSAKLSHPGGAGAAGMFHPNTPLSPYAGLGVFGAALGPSLQGKWKLRENHVITLGPGGTMGPGEGNFWRCIASTGGRFQYLLNWNYGKSFDFLTLSADGKTLTGRNLTGRSVTLTRADSPVDLTSRWSPAGRAVAAITGAAPDPSASTTTASGGDARGEYDRLKKLYASAVLNDWADTPRGQETYRRYVAARDRYRAALRTGSGSAPPPPTPPAPPAPPTPPAPTGTVTRAQVDAAAHRYRHAVDMYRQVVAHGKKDTPQGRRLLAMAMKAKQEYESLQRKLAGSATPSRPVTPPADAGRYVLVRLADGKAAIHRPKDWPMGQADAKNHIAARFSHPSDNAGVIVYSVAGRVTDLAAVANRWEALIGKGVPLLANRTSQRAGTHRITREYAGRVDGKAVRAVTLFAAHDGGVFIVLGLYAVSHEATLGQTVRHVLASLQLAS